MEIVVNHILEGKHNKPIVLDYGFNPNGKSKSVVIFAHGFKGFKDWGHFNKMMDYFVAQDFVFVKFNFSHNGGTAEQPIDFPDLKAFGNNNFTKELADIKTVVDWIVSDIGIDQNELDTDQIYLIGHSRGGGVSVVAAKEDIRIKKLVTWAAVSDLINRFSQQELAYWKQKGVMFIENSRTNQQMPLYYQLAEDTLSNQERFNIQLAAEQLSIPYLIVHGTDDNVVPLKEAKALNTWHKTSKLLVVDAADHVFGSRHPFEGDCFAEDVVTVLEETVQFLKK